MQRSSLSLMLALASIGTGAPLRSFDDSDREPLPRQRIIVPPADLRADFVTKERRPPSAARLRRRKRRGRW